MDILGDEKDAEEVPFTVAAVDYSRWYQAYATKRASVCTWAGPPSGVDNLSDEFARRVKKRVWSRVFGS